MPIYLSKALTTATSTLIGVFSTGTTLLQAAGSTGLSTTYQSSAFDTQRRLTLYTTGGSTDFSASFTITGTRQGGGVVTETITGSTAGTATNTLQDFLTVTSVAVSSVLQAPVTIGTGTVGGTPWQPVNLGPTPVNIGFGLVYSTTRVSLLGQIDVSYDSPLQGQANPNSTWGQPFPFAGSSLFSLSTAINTNSQGTLTAAVAAWRFTLTSTSTQTANSSLVAYLAAVPVGFGS
jgi:hypothetical protein